MNINGIEIERKYLIAMPDAAFLDNCERSEITQTYLRGDAYTTERVRKRVRGDTCEYTHTLKRKLNNMRRIEDEQVIGWPDALAKWAVRFQEADTHPFTDAQRKWMHSRGIKDVPVNYTRPERDVIDSFSGNLAGEWPGMVLAMFDKYYRSRMAKYGRVS